MWGDYPIKWEAFIIICGALVICGPFVIVRGSVYLLFIFCLYVVL